MTADRSPQASNRVDSVPPLGRPPEFAEDRLGRIQRLLTWAQFDNGAAHPVAGGLQTSTAPQ